MEQLQPDKVVIEPATRAFLASLNESGLKQIDEIPVEEARCEALSGQIWDYERKPVEISDVILQTNVGPIEVRTVRPPGVVGLIPAILYFHGGGWVLNNKDAHDRLLREIALGTDAMVVFVEYSRSPEAKYPTAIEEAFAATKWVFENGQSIGADPNRIAVAGDSSGANMAAAVTLLAKERQGPAIRFQVLFSPTLAATFNTQSYREFEEGYFLTTRQMKWFWDQYLPQASMRSQITASPVKASVEQLQGLPPALIITGEADVLRDEGEAYARKLIEAGVEVTAVRYLGTIHAFIFLNRLSSTPAALAALAQANDLLKKHLAIIK